MSKHIHKYRRVNIGRDGKKYWIMRCVKPGCTHYTAMASKLSCPMLRDSLAECHRCGDRFILNRRALRMERPCCDGCIKKKINDKVNEAERFFRELEESLKV